MYLLICLALLGSVASIPLNNEAETRNQNYVLPTTTFPSFYDVQLFLDPENEDYFYGNVSIRIIPRENTREIVMHAMEIVIENIDIFSERNFERAENLFENYTMATDDTHLLTIRLNREINAFTPHEIHIKYVAQYAENMFGVYVSNYVDKGETKKLVTSQLQPTFARRAFPCYDEPAIKARFRTTLYVPPAYEVVRSNMPERNDTLKEEVPGYNKHEFQDTPIMSTYLIAYLVSNFERISNAANPLYDVPFAVYSRPDTQVYSEFALDFGQKNMMALEEYTDFKYDVPKLDKVAVPDFAAGAMENWGLIIYREVALLVNDGVTTTAIKQNIGRLICHENMHQWFGNEVGPLSWTYTWLNEGFANFFENFATDLSIEGWRMMDQYVIALQNVFQSDAVLSVNPMTHPVFTPSEILGTFNAVAYQKSGSVIRMMQHFLTPEVFRQGLIIYIRNYSRRSAAPSDLYAALQQALDESNHTIQYTVSEIMDLWTNQGGFPVVTVTKSSPTANSVVVTQQRFLTDRSSSSSDTWHVPINWVLSSDLDFSDTKPQYWLPSTQIAQSINIPDLAEAEWFIVNKQQTGYYRVNYDDNNWQALAAALESSHEDIHLLNRAQLIDDSFNLARNGRLNYVYALQLSLYLTKEKDYIPWAAANAAFNYLDTALSGTPAVHELFQKYVLALTESMYEELGFEPTDSDDHITPFHRNLMLNIHCKHGNEDCLNTASRLLAEFRADSTNTIKADIQTTVYCSSLRGGSRENFDFLWDLYVKSTDSSEQSILLNALGCTSNEEARTFYLNQVIDDNSPVREQDRHTIVVSVTNASPENSDAALEFITENFHLIQPRVQGLTGTTNILNAFSRTLTTKTHQEKLQAFVDIHSDIFTAGELASIEAIRENLAAAIAWTDEYFSTVENWLEENYRSGAAVIKSTMLIFVSVILAVFYN